MTLAYMLLGLAKLLKVKVKVKDKAGAGLDKHGLPVATAFGQLLPGPSIRSFPSLRPSIFFHFVSASFSHLQLFFFTHPSPLSSLALYLSIYPSINIFHLLRL
jgi:hypothetical protein